MTRRNKFFAQPTTVDGIRFASKSEARRFSELQLLQRAGQIRDLVTHPVFPLTVNGEKIGRYTADFSYLEGDGVVVIEDVKSKATMTEAAALRIRLFEALTKIRVRVVERR